MSLKTYSYNIYLVVGVFKRIINFYENKSISQLLGSIIMAIN